MSQELLCKDCGRRFVFGEAEQARYARHGFAPPKRCRACRAARRAAKPARVPGEAPASARTPPPRASDGRAAPAKAKPRAAKPGQALHEVQCGACGALTYVPFEPTDLRPVYCETCFEYR